MSEHFFVMVLMVRHDHSSSSRTSKYTVSQSVLLLIMFSLDSKETPIALFTFLPCLFFPLFQNKLDFSPGSSVQGNPLEKGPGCGEISLLLVEGKKIHGGEWVRDKDFGSGALQGHFHSVKAVPPDWPPSRLEVCAKAPLGDGLMGD